MNVKIILIVLCIIISKNAIAHMIEISRIYDNLLKVKEKLIESLDPRIFLILFIGIFLRSFSFVFSHPIPDTYQYIEAARDILRFNYTSFRPPAFPLYLTLFLLIFQDGLIAVKAACLTASILLILGSYLVFKKAAFKILENEKNAKYVGLLVSFLISINFFFVINNGRGLREDIISLCLVLLFYFIFIASKKGYVLNHMAIIILLSFLTLVHPTTGLFFYLAFLVFYLIMIFFKLSHNISKLEFVVISVTFVSSYLFWLIFCFFKFGDPFITMAFQNAWFSEAVNLDFLSLEGMLTSIFRGIVYGIPTEIRILFLHISIIMTISFFLSLYYFRSNVQIKYLAVLIGINLLYLSIFVAAFANVRYFMYFFPFFFYG